MDKFKIINQLDIAHFYVEKLANSIKQSHEILYNENYGVETRYQMSLSFLLIAENAYLHYKGHQYNVELFGSGIEQLDQPYTDYVFELNEAIEEKEDNLTWLQSRYDSFKIASDSVLETFKVLIKQNH